MNKKCLLCDKSIPQKRFGKFNYNLIKYCSNKCTQTAWRLRHNPNIKSYRVNNPDFWKTETGIGFKWEQYVAKKIGAEHIKFNTSGEDLRLGKLKIDVKACELYKRKMAHGRKTHKVFGNWVFNRNSIKPMDYYYCVCLIKGKPVKELYIPADKFGKSGITIGEKSKYDIYKV